MKKNNRKTWLIGLSVLLSFLILGSFIYYYGTRDLPDQQITQIYYVDNISPAHEALIQRFNEEYRNKIEVVPIDLPFSKFSTNERKELLARSLRSKSDLIDVFAVDVIWAPRFAKWCQPLDMYFSKDELNHIMSSALQSCYYEEELVAVPLYTDIGLMYYRRDLLQQLPDYAHLKNDLKASITWERFIKLHRNLKLRENPFYVFPAKNYEGLICSYVEMISSQHHSIFSGDSINLDTPISRKSLDLLVDLVNKFGITPKEVVNYDEYQCYIYTLNNDGIFVRGWPGFLNDYRGVVDDSTKFDLFEMAALPHFKGNKPGSVFGGWNLMISEYSTKKYEAMQFVKFALKPENQKLLFQKGGFLPVHNDVYQDSVFLKKNQELKYYRQLLDRGIHRPYLEEYTKISDIMSYYIHLAIKNEMSPEKALQTATRLINSDKFIIK